jgi:hypothetical protein
MHWPNGNGILWITAISISAFILIPVYFFTGIRNPDTKVNTIVTTIILIGATGLLFTMTNLRPALKQTEIKMHSYIQNENLLKKIQSNGNINSTALLTDINTTCEKMKGIILKATIHQESVPPDFEESGDIIEEGGLGPEFHDDKNGVKLFSHLKEIVNKYNETSMENKIHVSHSILDVESKNINVYSNFVVLEGIIQLQMYLATSEQKLTAYN